MNQNVEIDPASLKAIMPLVNGTVRIIIAMGVMGMVLWYIASHGGLDFIVGVGLPILAVLAFFWSMSQGGKGLRLLLERPDLRTIFVEQVEKGRRAMREATRPSPTPNDPDSIVIPE